MVKSFVDFRKSVSACWFSRCRMFRSHVCIFVIRKTLDLFNDGYKFVFFETNTKALLCVCFLVLVVKIHSLGKRIAASTRALKNIPLILYV